MESGLKNLAAAAMAATLAISALSANAAAQSLHDYHYFSKSVGSGNARGWFRAGTEFEANTAYSEATGAGQLGVDVFGCLGEVRGVLYAKAWVDQPETVGCGFHRRLFVNGVCVRSQDYGVQLEHTFEAGPYYPIKNGIKYRYPFGPVTIKVTGNAGIGAELTGAVSRFVAASGEMHALTEAACYGTGYLRAGVSCWFAEAGVGADLRFGEIAGNATGVVNRHNLRVTLDAAMTAIKIKAYLYIEYWTFWDGWEEYRRKLFRWDSDAHSLGSLTFTRSL